MIVWIYGGGYINGSASMPLYWGDRLAHKGVIVVTIAYRLGPLGFLALPELTRESPHHSSGNYGLMDQIAALEWVQRNIAAFGGDPKCVTIAGQSSGSISVSILMASPLAKGLFQRAIGESGGLFEPLQLGPKFLLANAERDGEKYAVSLGAPSLKELRRLPAIPAHRQRRRHRPRGDRTLCASRFALRGVRFRAAERCPAADRFERRGGACDGGCLARDGRHVLTATWSAALANFPLRWSRHIPTRPTKRRGRRSSASSATSASAGTCGHGRGCKPEPGKSPVFYYSFRQQPPFPAGSVYAGWGASHFAELWYVFDHLDQSPWNWTAGDRKLADEMSSYWVNFARSGDPNGPGLPSWPAFTNAESKVQYLADPITVGGVANIHGLSVFDSVYTTVRGKPFAAPATAVSKGTP